MGKRKAATFLGTLALQWLARVSSLCTHSTMRRSGFSGINSRANPRLFAAFRTHGALHGVVINGSEMIALPITFIEIPRNQMTRVGALKRAKNHKKQMAREASKM